VTNGSCTFCAPPPLLHSSLVPKFGPSETNIYTFLMYHSRSRLFNLNLRHVHVPGDSSSNTKNTSRLPAMNTTHIRNHNAHPISISISIPVYRPINRPTQRVIIIIGVPSYEEEEEEGTKEGYAPSRLQINRQTAWANQ